MKKLLSLALLATMFGSLFLPLQSASAGTAPEGPDLPEECSYDVVYDALNRGAELIWAEDYDGYVRAGSGNQVIIGTYDDDDISGGSGNDVICGVDAWDEDVLRGGTGNDIIIASEEGEDILYGQSGNDLILGEGAHDCFGGSGLDTDGTYYGCHNRSRSIEERWQW